MYQDKLAHLKKQLQQLEDGTLPEYLKRKKKIEQQHKERLKVSDIFKEYEVRPNERIPYLNLLVKPRFFQVF